MSSLNYDLFAIDENSDGVKASRVLASLGTYITVAEDLYMVGTCVKLLVSKASAKEVGLHMLGLDIDETIQGVAIELKVDATKGVFDHTIGILPTAAEFVTIRKAIS